MTDLTSILADPSQRARLPAGMRNNNPGNIKFVGQRIPGIVGPSVNTDEGDPQAVFDSPESGMRAMYDLARRKYAGGKVTADDLIAGNGGWTPGNHEAAANVARYAGLDPHADLQLNDPTRAAAFLHGLILQEHGQSGNLYPTSMIASAIGSPPAVVGSMAPTSQPDPQVAAASPAQPQPQAPAPTIGQQIGHAIFGSMVPLPAAPAPTADGAIPAAVQAAATPTSQAHNVFGSLSTMAALQPQPQAPAPQRVQGPTPDQANALLKFVQSLQGRMA